MTLEGRDRAIVRLPQAEGRLTNTERVSLSASATLRRVRALGGGRRDRRLSGSPDPRLVGLGGVAFVLVTIDQQGRAALDGFETAVSPHPEMLDLYLPAGAGAIDARVAHREEDHGPAGLIRGLMPRLLSDLDR